MSMEIKSMALDLERGAMLFLLFERLFGRFGHAGKGPPARKPPRKGRLCYAIFKEPRVF